MLICTPEIAVLKIHKEAVAIKAIGVPRKNLALTNFIANSKARRYMVIEIYIAELVEVTEDNDSKKIKLAVFIIFLKG